MAKQTAAKANRPPSAVIDLATLLPLLERGERLVLVGPDGQPAAALVSLATLAELDQLREDLADAAAADAALAELAKPGVEPVPLEEMLAKHGL